MATAGEAQPQAEEQTVEDAAARLAAMMGMAVLGDIHVRAVATQVPARVAAVKLVAKRATVETTAAARVGALTVGGEEAGQREVVGTETWAALKAAR